MISKKATALAAATLRESTPWDIGIITVWSQASIVSCERPSPSVPRTMASFEAFASVGSVMDAMTERYEEITVCGKPALFTSIRIKRDTVPDGLYAYDVRHDDECQGIPCEIAPFVMVNHWGTIILAEPLELPDDGRRYIDEDTDWNYAPLDGEGTTNHKLFTTISDFMTAYAH